MDKTLGYAAYIGTLALTSAMNASAQLKTLEDFFIKLDFVLIIVKLMTIMWLIIMFIVILILICIMALPWITLITYLLFFRDRNWKKITVVSVIYLITSIMITVIAYLMSSVIPGFAYLIFIGQMITVGMNLLYIPLVVTYVLVERKKTTQTQ